MLYILYIFYIYYTYYIYNHIYTMEILYIEDLQTKSKITVKKENALS